MKARSGGDNTGEKAGLDIISFRVAHENTVLLFVRVFSEPSFP